MKKLIALALLLGCAAVQPLGAKEIRVKADLLPELGIQIGGVDKGYVVIESLTINRLQPVESGEEVEIDTELAGIQLGSARINGQQRKIVLKESDIGQLVKDIITAGFYGAGFKVVPSNSDEASAAAKVSIDLTSLWMWLVPRGPGNSKNQFYFDYESFVTSPDARFANVGTVQCDTYLNGDRDTAPRSYRNTLLRGAKMCIENLSLNIQRSVDIEKVSQQANQLNAESQAPKGLTESLEELSALLESAMINEDEYATLRKEALDNYLR